MGKLTELFKEIKLCDLFLSQMEFSCKFAFTASLTFSNEFLFGKYCPELCLLFLKEFLKLFIVEKKEDDGRRLLGGAVGNCYKDKKRFLINFLFPLL